MSTFTASDDQSRSGSHGHARTKAIRRIGIQLVLTIGLLLTCRLGWGVTGLHISNLLVNLVLGVWFSVVVLREWRRENPDPGDPGFPWMLVVLAAALICVTADGADSFVHLVYAGRVSDFTVIEGFNFSVQTVTTVGYGNWPLSSSGSIPISVQLVQLRLYSVFLMATGASLFTVVIGMMTTWLMQVK